MFFCTFKKPKTKKTMESLSIGLRNFTAKKLVLSLIFLLSYVFLTAQEKGIILKKENSKKTVFLEENRRVKIMTKADKKIIGNFTVLDNKTIVINNQEIAIDSIETISSHSKFSSVANPVFGWIGSGVYRFWNSRYNCGQLWRAFSSINSCWVANGFGSSAF
jgi:hypothetical protein